MVNHRRGTRAVSLYLVVVALALAVTFGAPEEDSPLGGIWILLVTFPSILAVVLLIGAIDSDPGAWAAWVGLPVAVLLNAGLLYLLVSRASRDPLAHVPPPTGEPSHPPPGGEEF